MLLRCDMKEFIPATDIDNRIFNALCFDSHSTTNANNDGKSLHEVVGELLDTTKELRGQLENHVHVHSRKVDDSFHGPAAETGKLDTVDMSLKEQGACSSPRLTSENLVHGDQQLGSTQRLIQVFEVKKGKSADTMKKNSNKKKGKGSQRSLTSALF